MVKFPKAFPDTYLPYDDANIFVFIGDLFWESEFRAFSNVELHFRILSVTFSTVTISRIAVRISKFSALVILGQRLVLY